MVGVVRKNTSSRGAIVYNSIVLFICLVRQVNLLVDVRSCDVGISRKRHCKKNATLPTAFSSVPTDLLQYIACVTNRYPDNRLAVTTLRTPDARSAQSNIVIVRFQSYAPTLRCRCVATTRLQPFGKGNDFSPAPHGQRRRSVVMAIKMNGT